MSRMRVMHVVGESDSAPARVAADLVRAHVEGRRFEPLLVLRSRRGSNHERREALRDAGLPVESVPGAHPLATVWALWRLCRRFQPTLVVAHGAPDHVWARWAAWLARVPYRVQVDHESHAIPSRWTRMQMQWLARTTQAFVGVSRFIAQGMRRQGAPDGAIHTIPTGLDVSRFTAVPALGVREPGLVMSARFARQKDHPTLIRALALLRDQHGLRPMLYLAGSGKRSHQQAAQGLAERLKLTEQVKFLGYEPQVAELLKRQQIFVLSTRWEGMPLALVEAMAAGCACVATLVPGVEGVLEHNRTGLLVPPEDPAALAAAIARLLTDPALAERLAEAARERALSEHGLPLMRERYEALFAKVCRLA